MNNFFLLNLAIEIEDYIKFKSGFEEIIVIKADCEKHDHLFKHDSVWELNSVLNLFYDRAQSAKAIIQFIEQLTKCDVTSLDELTLDRKFPEMLNAFLGFDFRQTTISTNRQVTNLSSFQNCKREYLWNLNPTTFWCRREILFPSLILCGEVENQINIIGNSSFFSQIIEKLKIFNRAVSTWINGSFNYKMINRNYALNISPESTHTMSRYGNERLFSLPDSSRKYFELHIKVGELRFHFFPDNLNHKVYVGYIGSHLTTISG